VSLLSLLVCSVEAPPDQVYDKYIDVEQMPSWSPWLRSVVVDTSIIPSVSTWTLGARGLTVSWRARNIEAIRGALVRWESITGLQNRGRVEFLDAEGDGRKTRVVLTVAAKLPKGIAMAATKIDMVGRFVEDTLRADLLRFRDAVAKDPVIQNIRSESHIADRR
jgi:uncharacterized membrane protein